MRRRKEVEALREQVASLEKQLAAERERKTDANNTESADVERRPIPPVLPEGRSVGVVFSPTSIVEAGAIAARFFAGSK